MKKYILIILPLLIMTLAGCEQKPKFKMDIYVNHDAEICGAKDPMNNIDWLKDLKDEAEALTYEERRVGKTDEYDKGRLHSYVEFLVFQDTVSGNLDIVCYNNGWVTAYDCDGTELILSPGDYPYNEMFVGTEKTMYSPSSESRHSEYKVPIVPCGDCRKFFLTHKHVDCLAKFERKPLN